MGELFRIPVQAVTPVIEHICNLEVFMDIFDLRRVKWGDIFLCEMYIKNTPALLSEYFFLKMLKHDLRYDGTCCF